MNYPKIIANFLVAFFTSILAIGVSLGMTQQAIIIALLNAFFTAGLSAANEMQKQTGEQQGKVSKAIKAASLGLVI